MKDVQEVQVTPNSGEVNRPETLNALKEQLEKENKDHKEIDMKEATFVEKKEEPNLKIEPEL